jgi:hypothetical protein
VGACGLSMHANRTLPKQHHDISFPIHIVNRRSKINVNHMFSQPSQEDQAIPRPLACLWRFITVVSDSFRRVGRSCINGNIPHLGLTITRNNPSVDVLSNQSLSLHMVDVISTLAPVRLAMLVLAMTDEWTGDHQR